MSEQTCRRPDHDVPGIICGYPLPCPWHTVRIDTTKTPPEITVPITSPPSINPEDLGKLKKIARILTEEVAP
jgi:hypothetical protein